MTRVVAAGLMIAVIGACAWLVDGAEPVAKPALKITPGRVIVPTDRMRRIWGELLSVDLEQRAGTFRSESSDEVLRFSVMPYATLFHHAAMGDLPDYRLGERMIFRLHENEAGDWIWLTYIQDELNFWNGHKEWLHVDRIDPAAGMLECSQGRFDKSFIRETGIVIETNADTRYWRAGGPASFAEIKVGDKLRTKTHLKSQGKVRVAWHVFLDEATVLQWQAEQKAVHHKIMRADGLPGYIDRRGEGELQLTIFQEASDEFPLLKTGAAVEAAPSGIDRKPTGQRLPATIVSIKSVGQSREVVLKTEAPVDAFNPPGIARLWVLGP